LIAIFAKNLHPCERYNQIRRRRFQLPKETAMTTTIEQQSVSTVLASQWQQLNDKIAALAEDFPESKYDFKSAPDTRSFADVLRHLAFWNQYVAGSAHGKQPDGTPNELPAGDYATKSRILGAFRRSSDDALDALHAQPGTLPPGIAELYITFLEHSSEHYGQLAVYCRLNKIVPPVSRG